MEMFGVSKYIAVPVAAIAVWLLIVGGSYKRVEKVFLILSLVFLTYVIAAFLAQPNWENAAINTIVPHVVYQQSFVSLVISMIGTTALRYRREGRCRSRSLGVGPRLSCTGSHHRCPARAA